jgi:hypothetical protein
MSHSAASQSRDEERSVGEIARDESISVTDAAVECFTQYAREKPEVVALWAFGICFVLGWKLKPW